MRARRACRLMPQVPPVALRREKMLEIFGAALPPRMKVSEFRQTLFERDDLAVAPSTVSLIRGHFGSRWLAENDPDLAAVLWARLSQKWGGHAS